MSGLPFKCDSDGVSYEDLPLKWSASALQDGKPNIDMIMGFLAGAVRDVEPVPFAPLGDFDNSRITRFILDQDIVVERSPPVGVPFGNLLRLSPDVLVGSYIGIQTAQGNPMLLFATVPAGILVVGAAWSLSKAMQKGLPKHIKKALERKKPGRTVR